MSLRSLAVLLISRSQTQRAPKVLESCGMLDLQMIIFWQFLFVLGGCVILCIFLGAFRKQAIVGIYYSGKMEPTRRIRQEDGILASARSAVKEKLALIAGLDRQAQKKLYQCDSMRLSLLEGRQVRVAGREVKPELRKIECLEAEIQQLSERKVEIANALYCSISALCEQAHELQSLDRAAPEGNADWELQHLLAECRLAEGQHYCYCGGTGPADMVMCEGNSCPRRWYHLACLGMNQESLPEVWLCDSCRLARLLGSSRQ